MIYFVTYFFSALACEVGCRLKSYYLKAFAYFGAIVAPAFLAGARDYSIGVDRSVYGDALFLDIAKSQDLLHLETKWDNWIEPGYIYFNFFVSRISNDVAVFYFFLAAVISSVVLMSFSIVGYKKYIGLGYAAYLFLFFQPSFNMMRQSLAASFALLAVAFLYRERKLFFLLALLLAYSVHHSSMVCFVFVPLAYFCKEKKSMYFYVTCAAVLFLLMASAGFLVDSFFPFLNMDASRYETYFTKSSSSMKSFNASKFILSCLFCFSVYVNKGRFLWMNSRVFSMLFILVLATIPFSQMGFFGGEYINRILVYFEWVVLLLYPLVISVSKHKKITCILLVLYFVTYWFYFYIIKNFNQTYPYTSQILGI